MSDTTNLSDIPFASSSQGAIPNIPIGGAVPPGGIPPRLPEIGSPSVAHENVSLSVDPVVMKKIVADLEGAAGGYGSGAVPIPQRNIPTETHMQSLVQDTAARPSAMPPSQSYALPHKPHDQSSGNKGLFEAATCAIDQCRDYIIASMLFMLFQLPFVRDKLRCHTPFSYMDDGNPSMSTLLFHSVVFGIAFAVAVHGQEYVFDFIK